MKKQGATVSVWIDQSKIDQLDRLAAKAGITRSKLLCNMIDVGVDEIKTMEALGVVQLALMLRDFKDALRNRYRKMKEEVEMLGN